MTESNHAARPNQYGESQLPARVSAYVHRKFTQLTEALQTHQQHLDSLLAQDEIPNNVAYKLVDEARAELHRFQGACTAAAAGNRQPLAGELALDIRGEEGKVANWQKRIRPPLPNPTAYNKGAEAMPGDRNYFRLLQLMTVPGVPQEALAIAAEMQAETDRAQAFNALQACADNIRSYQAMQQELGFTPTISALDRPPVPQSK